MVASKATRLTITRSTVVAPGVVTNMLDMVRDTPLLPPNKDASTLVISHTIPISQNIAPLTVRQGSFQVFPIFQPPLHPL